MVSHTSIIVFNVLVLLSVLLNACTLMPAVFSKAVSRSPGWYSLMTGWLLFSISYGLLVEYQEQADQPPLGLCTTQALLFYAVPPLVATSFLCYYIEFYIIISGLKSGNPRPPNLWRTFCLGISPWLVFLAMLTTGLLFVFPGGRLQQVRRAPGHYYCHVVDKQLSNITMAIVAGLTAIGLPLEAWIGLTIYWNWDAFRRLGQVDRRVYLTVYIRLTLSSICAVLAFMLSTLGFFLREPNEISLCYPIVAIIMAIAFGTQKDILCAWLFWRARKPCGSLIFKRSIACDTTQGTSSSGPLAEA